MVLSEALQMQYEEFETNVRKLDQLISQLELWSDEYTINHKKEEVRLPEYIELHLNLEAFKEALESEMNLLGQEAQLTEAVAKAKAYIEDRLKSYEETEKVIHDWIREMKNPYALIHNSSVLEKNKEYIVSIINE